MREINSQIRARNRLIAAAVAEIARLRDALGRARALARARARAGWARAAVEPARWARAATHPAGTPTAPGAPDGDAEARIAAGLAHAAASVALAGSGLAQEGAGSGGGAWDAHLTKKMAALAAPRVRERAAGRAEGRERDRERDRDRGRGAWRRDPWEDEDEGTRRTRRGR